jgi:hypothetical protein
MAAKLKIEKRGDEIKKKSCPLKLLSQSQPNFTEMILGTTRHNFGRGPSNDYFIKVWFQLSNWFQTRRFLCEFPIGSYVKPSSAVGAILVEGPNRRTHLDQLQPNFCGMIIGWPHSKIVSDDGDFQPTWPPR